MKLLRYTYRKLSLLFLFLMFLWGVLFYYAVVDEVMDETDDMLRNNAYILIRNTLLDPSVMDTKGDLVTLYSFRPLSQEEGSNYREHFYDSTVYVEIEDEYEPVRVMQTAFLMPDEQYYELTLMVSTMERDDLRRAMLWYLGILFLLFIACTSIGTRLVLKGVFRPLQVLLSWLHDLQPGKVVPLLDNPTRIKEFRELSKAAVDMANRSYKAYEEQKQFIENASHELQTPLAIVRGKIELLAESETLTEQQMKELDAIYGTLSRAIKLNKSLLLLSRIENGQYAELEVVSFDEIVDHCLPDLMDIYEHKGVHLSRCQQNGPFIVYGNRSLAHILVSNLIKNALLHNQNGGELCIVTAPDSMVVKNTGTAPLDSNRLFKRFYHPLDGKNESTGLGLAISYSIARSVSLELTYAWENGMHCFRLVKERKEE